MSTVTMQGNPIPLNGEFPQAGQKAPASVLTGADLQDFDLASLAGKTVLLNIFPSIDTSVCAQSVREFHQRVAASDNTVVVCVSGDLPFAAGRFCAAEGIENVSVGSTFRSDFARQYGVEVAEGALKTLTARAVVVIDPQGVVRYSELVSELANEPNYDAALAALNA